MGLFRRGRFWWISYMVNGRQIRQTTKAIDKKQARRIYWKMVGEMVEGRWFPRRTTNQGKSFKEMSERYMEEHSRIKKKSSKRDEISLNHLSPFFGSLLLSQITPGVISRYKALRYREKASPASLNREMALTKHMFTLAMKEWEWTTDNPVKKTSMEKERNERQRVLSTEEQKNLLSVSSEWLRGVILFALNSGCREQEILSLTWGCVNLEDKAVSILQGKTDRVKTIPLNSTLFDLLDRLRPENPDRDTLVFPSEAGTVKLQSNLRREFKQTMRKAGIEGFRFHDLRHCFGSQLVRKGVDIYTVKRLLGHSSIKMTERYSHLDLSSMRESIEVLTR